MMQEAKIIQFKRPDPKKNQLKKAYEWAVSEQKRHGIVATPINFIFEGDEIEFDQNEVYVSVFCDEENGNAILRRDWDEGFVVQYNVLANYEQLLKIAPNSIAFLKENGLKLYQRYLRAGFGF